MNELYNSCKVLICAPEAEVIRVRLDAAGISTRVVGDISALIAGIPDAAVMVIGDGCLPADGWAVLGEALAAHSANAPTVIPCNAIEPAVIAAQSAVRTRVRRDEMIAQLAEGDRRKDEFLAILGHELRNPLGAIQLAVEVKQLTSTQDKHSDVIARQLRNLGRIVDDLLDVSRVTQGKLQLSREDVDLGDSARRCVQALANEAARSRLSLVLEIPEQPVWVSGDPVRLDQVIANLVVNAIKYTPAGGEVSVTVEPDGTLTVEDTGIGIEPALVDGLFDLFAQAKDGIARSRGGLGLGLALVRRLVELHGGQVGAHSDGVGKGSRFWFRLADRR